MAHSGDVTIIDEIDIELEHSYDMIDQLRDVLRVHKAKIVFSCVVFFLIISGAIISVIVQASGRMGYMSSEARIVAGLSTLFGAFFLFETGSAAYSSYIIVIRGRRVLQRHLRAISDAEDSVNALSSNSDAP